jgi:hypothetical protein
MLMTIKPKNIIAITLSALAIAAAVAHAFFPDLQIDSTTAFLIAIAILPWLGMFFRSVELPGGIKVEYHELKEAEAKARDTGLITANDEKSKTADPIYERIAAEDPNLALAGLRIEIEKELVALATRHGIAVSRGSVLMLAKELTQIQVLGAGAYLALADIIQLLNKAVHGAKVEPESVSWALSSGSQILQSLRIK